MRLPLIYAITDRPASGVEDPAALAAELFDLGIRCVQIRDKELPDRQLLSAAERTASTAQGCRATVIVNDRVDIALCARVGVHLGPEDLPARSGREILGPDLPLGVSTHSAEEARRAFVEAVADYVTLGPVFASPTKLGRPPLGLDALAQAARAKSKPLVAIGGITVERLEEVWSAGADAAAMISGLLAGDRQARVRRALDLARRRWPLRQIFLVGFMGCGKTTLGQRLAARLGWEFLDLDREVERTSGKTVRAIFESEGESSFRDREWAFLAAAPQLGRAVIATGGGSFQSADNRREILRSGVAVYLDVPWPVLATRLRDKGDRPLFRDEAAAAELFADRLPSYRMAPISVRLQGTEDVERAVDRIMASLDEHTCVI